MAWRMVCLLRSTHNVDCDAAQQRIEHLGRLLVRLEQVPVVLLRIDILRHRQQQQRFFSR